LEVVVRCCVEAHIDPAARVDDLRGVAPDRGFVENVELRCVRDAPCRPNGAGDFLERRRGASCEVHLSARPRIRSRHR
jgi:hypothetical protein